MFTSLVSAVSSFVQPTALFCTAALIALPTVTSAQGITSSSIAGVVASEDGKPIVGAAVKAVHTPTNTTYEAVTSASGRFGFSGVRVGGPYLISATAEGYTIERISNAQTYLGESTEVRLNAVPKAGEQEIVLEDFKITASALDLNSAASGSGTMLDSRRISIQPTSTNSFTDLIKTNPFVTVRTFPQVTAIGMNNRYNSISLDGARLNDQFGLASSGLFSLKNPFSLDAIDQFSVSVTPYDVTQSGFAGASINAVSKSGTNEFHGSTYYLYSSYKWQGEDVSGSNEGNRPTPFYERSWGATLGGPIVPDRLFFFLNYERFENPSGSPSDPGFNPDPAFLTFIQTQIAALPDSPDLGTFGGAGANLDSDTKRLAKIDWNINKQHRLSVRYSDTDGARPSFNSFSPGTGFSSSVSLPGVSNSGYVNGITSLSSSFYTLAVLEEVWAAQLFSNWTSSFKTQLNYSRNDSSSLRTTPAIFPEIRILNVPGTSNATPPVPVSTLNAFTFGTEVSSMGNGIIIEGETFSATADYTWNDFAFRAGIDHEKTDFNNLFRNGSYGVFAYNYSPTLNLANDTPLSFARNVSQEGFPMTDISRYEQTGFFAQTKWEPTMRFNLTLGLRYDALGSPIAPPTNTAFSTAFERYYPGIRNDGTIDGTSRWAPRISFNYALDEKRNMQLRGGVGVFLGRSPWVWISNSYANSGVGRYTITTTPASLSSYLNTQFDPSNPMGTGPAPTVSATQAINFIEPGLNLPTNTRGNLALDLKVPALKATFTVEFIFNKQTEAMFYENLNLRVLNGDAANQPTATSRGADGRLRFVNSASNAPLVAGYRDVLRLSNVTAGESRYLSFMLDRPLDDGWAYNIAYTRGDATEAQPAGSSTAGSNYVFNAVFNQGALEVTRSDYEITDRVQASVSREFSFLERFKTIISLYYEGRSGQPFSYVYGADLNRDGGASNDLVFVPTGPDDARFDFSGMSSTQRDAYFEFIETSGLKKYSGRAAPRNAFTTPWQNRLDLRVTQQIRTFGKVELELFADFINFGSFVSEDLFNYVETINTTTTNSNQNRALGSAAYTASGLLRPTVNLTADGDILFPNTSLIRPNNADSRWRIQGGVRVKF